MTRTKATILHFCVSSFIVGNVLAVIFLLWYPYPYFSIVGAMDIIKVLICVDVVAGPLMTLILYKPGKWGMKFDMACVFLLQLGALAYGTHLIYTERPYYMVFAVDRFEVVSQRDVDQSQLDPVAFTQKPWAAPIYAVARLPEDARARERVMEETLFEGKPDIQYRPEFWATYASGLAAVAANVKPLMALASAQPLRANTIADVLVRFPDQEIVYAPVMARGVAKTLLLDKESLLPVGVLDIDPWAGTAARASAPAMPPGSGLD